MSGGLRSDGAERRRRKVVGRLTSVNESDKRRRKEKEELNILQI